MDFLITVGWLAFAIVFMLLAEFCRGGDLYIPAAFFGTLSLYGLGHFLGWELPVMKFLQNVQ